MANNWGKADQVQSPVEEALLPPGGGPKEAKGQKWGGDQGGEEGAEAHAPRIARHIPRHMPPAPGSGGSFSFPPGRSPW